MRPWVWRRVGWIFIRLGRIHLYRFPILIAFALLLIPAGILCMPAMLGGLADLSPLGTGFASWLAFLLAFTSLTTARLVRLYGYDRLGGTFLLDKPSAGANSLSRGQFLRYAFLAVPLVIVAALNMYGWHSLYWSSSPHPRRLLLAHGFAAGLGFAAAFSVLVLASYLEDFLSAPPIAAVVPVAAPLYLLFAPAQLTFRRKAERPEAIESWLKARWRAIAGRIIAKVPEEHGRGYIEYRKTEFKDPENPDKFLWAGVRIHAGQLLALSFLILSALVYLYEYVYFFVLLRLPPFWERTRPSALAYLLLLLIAVGWVLALVGFLLDRYRIPTLALLAVISVLVNLVSDTDHYFPLERGAPTRSLSPADAVRFWLARHPEPAKPPLVAVAAAGGGIQAAAWTARVLTGLAEDGDIGRRFADSLRLVSSNSGGSVGAMYFVNAYRPTRPGQGALTSKTADLEDIVQLSARSSLEHTAWGLAYPDLWRLLVPFFVRPRTMDRAWAMEQAWMRPLGSAWLPADSRETISSWRAGVEQGWRPSVMLNSTLVEKGDPVLITNFDMQLPAGYQSFGGLYPASSTAGPGDLSIITAARLSATFPYVTPIARAVQNGQWRQPEFHFADGGYYDNFGLLSLLHWLEPALEAYERGGGRKALIILIRAFPDPGDSAKPARQGWPFEAVGPLRTLMKVRDSAQITRDIYELALFRQAYRGGPQFSGEIADFEFPFSGAPLSWHLTREQIRNIDDAWSCREGAANCAQILDNFKKVKDFLKD